MPINKGGFSWLFALRGELTKQQQNILTICGLGAILGIWILLTSGSLPILPKTALPHPMSVLGAFGDLYRDNELVMNLCKSIGLNLGGYIKAILWSIPIGFAIGLVPLLRGMFQKVIDAIRFIPLTAVTMLFIIWYGIYVDAKINFLAFGIFIYLLPVIIQRIDEVDDVYLKTVHTLGASYWQTIKTVYLPAVLTKLSDDIRILTAISWTYIIVAETNADQGGIGSLIFRTGQRMGRVDKTFACLILIIIVGIFQDRIFAYIDRTFFPHKYQLKNTDGKISGKNSSLLSPVFDFVFQILTWLFLGIYLLLLVNEFFPFIGDIKPLTYLFGEALWSIHFIFGLIIFFRIRSLFFKRK
jgi:ABC-type nitrate/sulfonate/bicarbonate transport system permease component